jgi:hypothetical protein
MIKTFNEDLYDAFLTSEGAIDSTKAAMDDDEVAKLYKKVLEEQK